MKFSIACTLLALTATSTNALLRDGNHVQNVVNDLLHDREKDHGNLKGVVGESVTHFYNDALLDHFTNSVTQSTKTWNQRYYTDDQFWCGKGCPIFLYIGGEGPQGPVTSKLFMYELAKEHGALMVALEHRFYGESYPTVDMSDSNLVYLTSDQALADLARFIKYVGSYAPTNPDNHSTPPLTLKDEANDSKWIAFGGSYPGNLATWLKLKYPALLAGSVGSSAPVKADYNFFEYAQVVGKALAYPLIGGSEECYDVVERAMTEIHDLVTDGRDRSHKNVPNSLKPCDAISGVLDLYTYESNVYGNFQGAVQYNLQKVGGVTVSQICSEMTNKKHGSALDALASMVGMYFPTPADPTDPSTSCIASSWKSMLGDLTNVKFDGQSAMRQWIYQSCNEFGYFQTTEGIGHPFTSLTSASLINAGKEMCEQAYNIKDYHGPQRSGANGESYASDETYGARSIQGANITMPNGNMDPWHSLSVINSTSPFYSTEQSITESETIVFIDGTAHCRDMYAPNAFAPSINDTVPVIWAHSVISENVAKYLKD